MTRESLGRGRGEGCEGGKKEDKCEGRRREEGRKREARGREDGGARPG